MITTETIVCENVDKPITDKERQTSSQIRCDYCGQIIWTFLEVIPMHYREVKIKC